MRIHEFRGKREDSKGWAYGTPIYPYGDHVGIIEKGSAYPIGVIPETVGEFTGLKDKNGVKIYEGDILLRTILRANISPMKKRGVVVWVNGGFFVEPIGARGRGMNLCGSYEVIGNIHDNPELLKMPNPRALGIRPKKGEDMNIQEIEARAEKYLSGEWTTPTDGRHCAEDVIVLLAEVKRLRAERDAANMVLENIYDRTKPDGIEGGYPYGATSFLGVDVYNMVLAWRGQSAKNTD